MRKKSSFEWRFRHLAVGAAILAAACAPRVATHGNLPDPDKLAEIVPGKVAKDQVVEILGSPSSIAAFNEETWYYISERQETTAFLAPDVTDRKVITIRFDKKGTVTSVDTRGLDEARVIQPVDRKTPTAGNEITIIQQLLGNLGRFNKDSDTSSNTK